MCFVLVFSMYCCYCYYLQYVFIIDVCYVYVFIDALLDLLHGAAARDDLRAVGNDQPSTHRMDGRFYHA